MDRGYYVVGGRSNNVLAGSGAAGRFDSPMIHADLPISDFPATCVRVLVRSTSASLMVRTECEPTRHVVVFRSMVLLVLCYCVVRWCRWSRHYAIAIIFSSIILVTVGLVPVLTALRSY